jgi:RHS repeat-associated protein
MSYPFQLPPARGAIQPSLGLQYSSTGGDSDAGYAWSVNLPFIERRGAGGAPDPQYNDPIYNTGTVPSAFGLDHFKFMGSDLVPLCLGISDHAPCKVSDVLPGAMAADQFFQGWSVFRTQVERGPAHAYLWSPNRQTWVVLGQDGSWMELGTSLNGQTDGAERDTLRDGRSGVFRWHIARIYDARRTTKLNPTNPIVYVWSNNPVLGLELQDIFYTPTDPDNAITFAGYAHHVHLTYGAFPFPKGANFTRWRATPLHRLTGVDIASQDITGSQSGARAMVRRYHLTYDDSGLALAMHPHHSHLKTITLEGRCTNSTASVTGGTLEGPGALLPATNCPTAPTTTFGYANGLLTSPKATPLVGLSSLNSTLRDYGGSSCIKSNGKCIGCLDDTMYPEPVCANNVDTTTCPCLPTPATPVNELRASSFVDFDNDGLPDLLVPQVNGRRTQALCLNTGSSGFSCTGTVSGMAAANGAPVPTGENVAYAGDFSADGQLNWLTFGDEPSMSDPGDTEALQKFAVFSPAGPISGSYLFSPNTQNSWNFVPPLNAGGIKRILESRSGTADVNGDGLVDLLVHRSAAIPPGKTQPPPGYAGYAVAITTRNAAGTIIPFGHPQQIPAEHSDLSGWMGFGVSSPKTAAPIWVQLGQTWNDRAQVRKNAGKKPPKSGAFDFADVDGDGLVDVVAVTTLGAASAYALRFWPGYGDGTFGNNLKCTRTLDADILSSHRPHVECVQSGPEGGATLTGGPTGLDPDETKSIFHDVTGDGLADLITATLQEVKVYVNLDGTRFNTTPWITLPASSLGDAWVTDQAKLTFADINGSGTEDLVFADKAMAYVDPFAANGTARPGLLERIDNGVGGVTTVAYDTIARLDKAAALSSAPWKRHSAQSNHVVTSVSTTNGLTGTQRLARTTRYTYRDPVYEPHTHAFRGFEYVESTRDADAVSPGTTTATTFLVGLCTHNQATPCATSYDNPWDALRGLPVLSVTRTATQGAFAGTPMVMTHTRYQVRQLVTPTQSAKDDFRAVRLVYPDQTDTYLIDPNPSGGTGSGIDQLADLVVGTASDSVLVGAPRALSFGPGTAHLRKNVTLDDLGRPILVYDYGHVTISSQLLDPVIVTQNTYAAVPGAYLGLVSQLRTTNTLGGDAQGNLVDGGRTKTFDYDVAGSPTDITVTLDKTLALSRAGNVAVPSSAAPVASHAVRVFHASVDPTYGFVISKTGAVDDPALATFTVDPRWHQFVTGHTVRTGTQATNFGSIVDSTSYDIGLGRTIATVDPSGAMHTITYDGLDRIISTGAPMGVLPTIAGEQQHVYYFNAVNGVRRIHTQTAIASPLSVNAWQDSWSYVDGLGRPLATLTQADPNPTSGDGAPWIAHGLTDWTPAGLVARSYVAMPWTGDPATATAPPVPKAGLASMSTTYDALGRVLQTTGFDVSLTSKSVYHALSVDRWDAEDLDPNSLHVSTPTTVTRDGHGRVVFTTETSRNPTPSSVTTATDFLPTGEPWRITRTFDKGPSAGGGTSTYVRSMAYDTMGRLVQNVEPNTSTTTGPGLVKAWTYAYDHAGHLVATADARGCGKNLFFDAAGRKLAADYVPCTVDQAAYSAPNLSTGEGTEAFYRYDTPEPGQVADVTAAMWKGRLVSISDRAAHTRFNYDGRGHVVRTSRQLAKPDAGGQPLATRYAPFWFEKTAVYDYGNRLTSESTGADAPELLVNGKSTVTTDYNVRGLVKDVTSDYGTLIASFKYDTDGDVLSQVYGDAGSTTSTMWYETTGTKHLKRALLARGDSSGGSAGFTGFGTVGGGAGLTIPAGPSTAAMTLSDTTSTYDRVGNPLTSTEATSAFDAWGAGAKPVTRKMTYDDRYRLTKIAYDSHADIFKNPVPAGSAPVTADQKRITSQTFEYDGLGNITNSTDDGGSFFDRSLGKVTNAPNANRVTSAAGTNGSLTAQYDNAGNTTSLVVRRTKACFSTCGTVTFAYTWDEAGKLASASRTDDAGAANVVTFVYDASGQRVLSERVASRGFILELVYNAEIFTSLRLNRAHFEGTDYEHTAAKEAVYLTSGASSIARVLYSEDDLPSLTNGKRHVLLEVSDKLGSTSFVIDKETSDIVERRTYQAFGGVESEYQSDKWKGFREEYGFTGKEADLDIGLTYFGARYYSPELGRFISPDPVTVHANGADPNPYAYVSGHVYAATDPEGYQMIAAGFTATSLRDLGVGEQPSGFYKDGGDVILCKDGSGCAVATDAGSYFSPEITVVGKPPPESIGEAILGAVQAPSTWWNGFTPEEKHRLLWNAIDPNGAGQMMIADVQTALDPSESTPDRLAHGVLGIAAMIPLFEAEEQLGNVLRFGAVESTALRVTAKGILRIEGHLGQLGALDDSVNAAMLGRLRAGETSAQDLNFYLHELKESAIMARTGGYGTYEGARAAHLETLQWQGIPYVAGYESQLYHSTVIRSFSEMFNPAAWPK